MEKVISHVQKGWKILAGVLGAITLFFGTYQVYDHFTTPEISGQWYITLTVKNSSYHAYIGDVIGIKAFFNQTDKNITGSGEKWDYRGKPIEYKLHDKLDFNGCLDGDCFKANYTLYGKKRQTTGIIDVIISNGGKRMEGTFTGTAADTQGTLIAEKR